MASIKTWNSTKIANKFYLTVLILWSHLLTLKINAIPSTTFAPTTHIASFVHQGEDKNQSNEVDEFDFERIEENEVERNFDLMRQPQRFESQLPLPHLYGRLIQKLDANLDNNNNLPESYKELAVSPHRDDLLTAQQNKLHNAEIIFGRKEQHESSSNAKRACELKTSLVLKRVKQSIPVLEPVKHLLNTVRGGALNQTAHVAKQHHELINAVVGMGRMDHNESSAIETEDEREMTNESTEFQLLDFLGSIVGMFWSLISNIQRIFASSSGSASAILPSA